jgi:hypothetical protein
MEVDTLDKGKETVVIEFYYPRQPNNPDTINISLFDVRAANDITIKYDFDRDGWVIYSDLIQPGQDEDIPDELTEVAFIEAWPERKN